MRCLRARTVCPLTSAARALVSSAALALAGCSVTALEERERAIAVNQCESNEECSGRCSGGMCVALVGELTDLLFEVTPTERGASLSGASFLIPATGIQPADTARPVSLDLSAVDLTGTLEPLELDCEPVFAGPDGSELEPATDGTIPARFTVRPAFPGTGLHLASRVVEAPSGFAGAARESYAVQLNVPVGVYDVYIEPYERTAASMRADQCRFSPVFLRNICLREAADLQIEVPRASQLKLSIVDREKRLDKWVVDLVDAVTGRVLSDRVPLTLPSTDGGVSAYAVTLNYQPVAHFTDCEQQSSSNADQLVRLTPPPGTIAPTVLFTRQGLEIFSPGHARIDLLPALPNPVTVEGHVFSSAGPVLSGATLMLVARRALEGIPDGVLTAFSRQVETDAQGEFEVELFPGVYDVQIAPRESDLDGDPPLASTWAVWEVAGAPSRQAGRVVELSRAMTVAGSAYVPIGNNQGARGAQVVAQASHAPSEEDLLVRSLHGLFRAPRATSTTITDANGAFRITADRGEFDLSIRPPEGSDFAWLVFPKLAINEQLEPHRLAQLRLPLPVVLDVRAILLGMALDQVQGARVRAYAPINAEDASATPTFVPVAESRLDDRGRAMIFVPARLQGLD